MVWCDEPWWFSLTPSRKEKLRGETSLANCGVPCDLCLKMQSPAELQETFQLEFTESVSLS
jgi:hypothetical protein